MTRIVVDKLETQQDRLQFGDPIGCSYHWLEPDQVDSYGDSVRRLSTKVELAADAFDRTANLSEDVFAGEAADVLRSRAENRHQESVLVRDNLRGLGRAINAYSDVLRRHRDGLQELQAFGATLGLEIRGNAILAPVETIAGDAPQKEIDSWEAHWKAYRECFDIKIELRDARRLSTRELVKALAEFADVHPDKDKRTLVAANANQVRFGELRREAAEEAMESVQANTRSQDAQRALGALKQREQSALDHLEQMVLQERPPEEIQAQADRVATIHGELGEARNEANAAAVAADHEQAQANHAARNLEDAQDGTPRSGGGQAHLAPLKQQVAFDPAPHLKDRLG